MFRLIGSAGPEPGLTETGAGGQKQPTRRYSIATGCLETDFLISGGRFRISLRLCARTLLRLSRPLRTSLNLFSDFALLFLEPSFSPLSDLSQPVLGPRVTLSQTSLSPLLSLPPRVSVRNIWHANPASRPSAEWRRAMPVWPYSRPRPAYEPARLLRSACPLWRYRRSGRHRRPCCL